MNSHVEHKAQGPALGELLRAHGQRHAHAGQRHRRAAIRDLLESAGHSVSGHDIVRDEPRDVAARVSERLRSSR